MIIVKELEWLRDYATAVAYLLPKIKQVRKVSSKKANHDRGQHFVGIITYYDLKSYRICLYTTYKPRNIGEKLGHYSTLDILCAFAHELAHLEHWTHTPEHKQLECNILGIFMHMLKQDGYVSEEEEIKNGMFYEREDEE